MTNLPMDFSPKSFPLFGGQRIEFIFNKDIIHEKHIDKRNKFILFASAVGQNITHIMNIHLIDNVYFSLIPENDIVESKKVCLHLIEINNNVTPADRKIINIGTFTNKIHYFEDNIDSAAQSMADTSDSYDSLMTIVTDLYTKSLPYLQTDESLEKLDMKLCYYYKKYTSNKSCDLQIAIPSNALPDDTVSTHLIHSLFKLLDQKSLIHIKNCILNPFIPYDDQITDNEWIYSFNQHNVNSNNDSIVMIKTYNMQSIVHITCASSNHDFISDYIKHIVDFVHKNATSNNYEISSRSRGTTILIIKENANLTERDSHVNQIGNINTNDQKTTLQLQRGVKSPDAMKKNINDSEQLVRSVSDSKSRVLEINKEGDSPQRIHSSDAISSMQCITPEYRSSKINPSSPPIVFSPESSSNLSSNNDSETLDVKEFLVKNRSMSPISNSYLFDKKQQPLKYSKIGKKISMFIKNIKIYNPKKKETSKDSTTSKKHHASISLSDSDIKPQTPGTKTEINNKNVQSSDDCINNETSDKNDNASGTLTVFSLDRTDSWSSVADVSTLEKMNRKERRRQDVIFEMIKTEHNYVKTLRNINSILCRGLITQLNKSDEDLHKLLPKIAELIGIHGPFLANLTKLQNTANNRLIRNIGNVLAAQFLNSYKTAIESSYSYIGINQKECVEYYKHLMKNDRKFADFMETLKNNIELARLSIPGCLTLINQRIVKYPILIDEIIKNTDVNDNDYPNLILSYVYCRHVIRNININVENNQTNKHSNIKPYSDPKCTFVDKNGRKYNLHEMLNQSKCIKSFNAKLESNNKIYDIVLVLLDEYFVLLDHHNQKYFFHPFDNGAPVIPYIQSHVRTQASSDLILFIMDTKNSHLNNVLFEHEDDRTLCINTFQTQEIQLNKSCSDINVSQINSAIYPSISDESYDQLSYSIEKVLIFHTVIMSCIIDIMGDINAYITSIQNKKTSTNVEKLFQILTEIICFKYKFDKEWNEKRKGRGENKSRATYCEYSGNLNVSQNISPQSTDAINEKNERMIEYYLKITKNHIDNEDNFYNLIIHKVNPHTIGFIESNDLDLKSNKIYAKALSGKKIVEKVGTLILEAKKKYIYTIGIGNVVIGNKNDENDIKKVRQFNDRLQKTIYL